MSGDEERGRPAWLTAIQQLPSWAGEVTVNRLREATGRGRVPDTIAIDPAAPGGEWTGIQVRRTGEQDEVIAVRPNSVRFTEGFGERVVRGQDTVERLTQEAVERLASQVGEEVQRRVARLCGPGPVRVVPDDVEPDDLTRALAGTRTISVEMLRRIERDVIYGGPTTPQEQGLLVESDADGGWPVPADLQAPLQEAMFRGVPIRYRQPEPPDRCYCDVCQGGPREPWPDPIRAQEADPDRVAEHSIDATCTPWELEDVEPLQEERRALSWDEFLKQSSALIDDQKRRGE